MAKEGPERGGAASAAPQADQPAYNTSRDRYIADSTIQGESTVYRPNRLMANHGKTMDVYQRKGDKEITASLLRGYINSQANFRLFSNLRSKREGMLDAIIGGRIIDRLDQLRAQGGNKELCDVVDHWLQHVHSSAKNIYDLSLYENVLDLPGQKASLGLKIEFFSAFFPGEERKVWEKFLKEFKEIGRLSTHAATLVKVHGSLIGNLDEPDPIAKAVRLSLPLEELGAEEEARLKKEYTVIATRLNHRAPPPYMPEEHNFFDMATSYHLHRLTLTYKHYKDSSSPGRARRDIDEQFITHPMQSAAVHFVTREIIRRSKTAFDDINKADLKELESMIHDAFLGMKDNPIEWESKSHAQLNKLVPQLVEGLAKKIKVKANIFSDNRLAFREKGLSSKKSPLTPDVRQSLVSQIQSTLLKWNLPALTRSTSEPDLVSARTQRDLQEAAGGAHEELASPRRERSGSFVAVEVARRENTPPQARPHPLVGRLALGEGFARSEPQIQRPRGGNGNGEGHHI